uniref:LOW QUALITY PROTEIN: rab GTPase-activating protein 1-like n=1 Tax=Petromyzon marinus TaxID=7757 RepID=A0AAJ7XC87_PETMA|nr:LOW QUALITY PROTEIN: rab GTPase-activating protein 1-like [Petromyzon marinus]
MAEVAGARKVSCSSDSVSTPNSEDFVLVPGSPAAPPSGSDGTGLKIPGAGNESALEEQLAAMLSDCAQDEEDEEEADDDEEEAATRGDPGSAEGAGAGGPATGEGASVMAERTDGEMRDSQTVANNPRCSKEGPRGPDSASPTSARGDEDGGGSGDGGGGELLVFPRVTYLGSASVDAPRSELEALRVAAILRQQCLAPLEVALAVPTASGGSVRILEADSSVEIARYPVQRILFCVRGHRTTQESDCFGFTESHNAADIFRIHVFRCPEPHEVSRLLHGFAAAFEVCARPTGAGAGAGASGPGSSPALTASTPNPDLFTFTVAMEIREDDGKGNFSAVPVDKEKQYFKLRSGVEKKLVLNVNQASSRELTIERCFGVFLGPGCGVQPGDLHLLNMESMGKSSDSKSYVIAARWDPTLATFHGLNDETAKDKMAHLTVAADLVVTEVQDPVRFLFEAPARVFPATERFWYFGRRAFTDTFHLHLRQLPPRDETTPDEARACPYELLALTSDSERQRASAAATGGGAAAVSGGAGGGLAGVWGGGGGGVPSSPSLTLSARGSQSSAFATPTEDEDDGDNDEPLLSGSGDVSRECAQKLLEAWSDLLAKWHGNPSVRPRQLPALVRGGVPEALRGDVWQLLAGCRDDDAMLDNYRMLVAKVSPQDSAITRDINRTFPAHGYFKDSGGDGQDSLYKICKAYSIYDEEIGYCQGQSFLAAVLLLHMPEEQAFGVLVRIMFAYGLRDLFRQNFDDLHCKFYQLERLMQEHVPELYAHFLGLGLEAHMYASQWFLTLFTAKFPLYMVFHIIDLLLSEGLSVIFNVALALLKTSREDLLQADFEGALKFFRVQLPKRYRAEESARRLMEVACGVKVSQRRLKKFEREFLTMREQMAQEEDPVERLKREGRRLQEANLRLEQENDDLAHELVTSKIALRGDLDKAEDKVDVLTKELLLTKQRLLETEGDKRRMEEEAVKLKELCRREMEKAGRDMSKSSSIIGEYKQICSQLSIRLEQKQASSRAEMDVIRAKLRACGHCSGAFHEDGGVRGSGAAAMGAEAGEEAGVVTSDGPATAGASAAAGLLAAAAAVAPVPAEGIQSHLREMELELAQTKLKLVEAECRIQDLEHELNGALNEVQASRRTWLNRTLSSLKTTTTGSQAKEPV